MPRLVSTTRALALLTLIAAALPASAQQIAIPRINQMPALPADYQLRDWDRVAAGYDSLVFDLTRTGTYVPLAAVYNGTVNYPEHPSFGIESYVGSGNEVPGEGITVLSAVVGGSLAGANKRTQFGRDWALMAEEFFNRRPEQNIYLNGPQSGSGQDWWYDTMPNVFFYQMRALYPNTGHFNEQFTTVANQWLRATERLGGRTMPWALPSFQYRGFNFATMNPNSGGVVEPEAAGAIGWMLYMAYVQTGEERYRIGAEQSLEALNAMTQSPAYELQLPYGVFAAARMNAELGTNYDVERMLGWVFNRSPLRAWGTIQGITRGGYTLDGLVGEVDGDGYGFALNGFQQAAALVPLVRYDDRFARAIGRWMVNLASASRLYYHPYLPNANQDGEVWGQANDPRGLIGYEAIRGNWQGTTPFATGDALRNGWAPTNFGLYGASSVGYLAAVVDPTNVTGILRLDLRKTDWYRSNAYQSFLVYNPHGTAQDVQIPLTFGTYDVYDAATDTWLARGVQGTATVNIPADAARVLIFPTSGGTEATAGGRLTVNGVVVDYRYGPQGNRPPRVKALVATATTVSRNTPTTLYCTGADAEGPVTVQWSSTGGTLTPNGAQATWVSPELGDYGVTCTVTDNAGQTASQTLTIHVVANQAPRNVTITANPAILDPGGSSTLSCLASDPDNDPITYTWTAEAGTIGESGANVPFIAPEEVGVVTVSCTAADPSGASTTATFDVFVGRTILNLPLDGGSGTDLSGYGHDAVVSGAVMTAGHDGAANGALLFDGVDDVATVASEPTLNPTQQVSLGLWVRPGALPDRESFLISHGSWQNRWKLSLTPNARARWTVRTTAGTVDVDAAAPITSGAWVHLAATYDGTALKVYVNGQLSGQAPLTGLMAATDLPLMLGQMLPTDAGYNFAGSIDEVHVFNRALSDTEVLALYGGTLAGEPGATPRTLALGAPYPNPSRGRVTIPFQLPTNGAVTVRVVDVLGRTVATLYDGQAMAGAHTVEWEGAAGPGVSAGVYLVQLEADGVQTARSFLLVR